MEKTIHEKIKSLRDKIYCMVYDDENKKNPYEHTSSNMFFTEEIQQKYQNIQFTLKSEIKMASKNIETAKEQINYCENILLG